MIKLRTGPWCLSELNEVPKNGMKVFSCFHCGGGSTMGYKLAGFEVLGGVEIDPDMMKVYRANHHPKHSYLMGVQQFKNIPNGELPKELFELDILDGSPPCSSFSMAGSREKKWGRASKFREGQSVQHLDDLFFDFIDVAKKLQPKVIIAENVKGLIQGNARGYVKQIFQGFKDAGYSCQLFLLNASRMGVPQMRERTFFIANKLDKKIKLEFNEPEIVPKKAFEGINEIGYPITGQKTLSYWTKTTAGNGFGEVGGFNSHKKLNPVKVAFTQTGTLRHYHWYEPSVISDAGIIRLQTFPEDYNFCGLDAGYVCGMSVPPFMMQRVACEVYRQILN
jgi:DNA (cytosine-5)-methyltransferase 1